MCAVECTCVDDVGCVYLNCDLCVCVFHLFFLANPIEFSDWIG